jgi:hypothetical protein
MPTSRNEGRIMRSLYAVEIHESTRGLTEGADRRGTGSNLGQEPDYRGHPQYLSGHYLNYRQDRISRKSVVDTATGYKGVGVRVPEGSRILFSPCRKNSLWG